MSLIEPEPQCAQSTTEHLLRERYGVYGAEALEEVLLFGGRSREKVEQCKKMLEEMWKLRRRIEPVQ